MKLSRIIVPLLVIAAFAPFTAFAQPDNAPSRHGWSGRYISRYKLAPLFGEVQSVTAILYDANEDKTAIDRDNVWRKELFVFNQNGDVAEYYTYTGNSQTPESKTIYTYNAEGDVVGEVEYDANRKLTKRTIYNYGPNNKAEELLVYNSVGELTQRAVYKYNADTNAKEQMLVYDGNGVLSQTFTYNANGQKVENKCYSNGQLESSYVWEYDARGTVIYSCGYEHGEWGSSVTGCNKVTNIYDEAGNLVEWIDNDGEHSGTDKYDDEGKLLESTMYWDGALDGIDCYTYDSHGNEVQVLSYGDEEKKRSYGGIEYKIVYLAD